MDARVAREHPAALAAAQNLHERYSTRRLRAVLDAGHQAPVPPLPQFAPSHAAAEQGGDPVERRVSVVEADHGDAPRAQYPVDLVDRSLGIRGVVEDAEGVDRVERAPGEPPTNAIRSGRITRRSSCLDD
jgi:hypothetical protein